MAVVIVVEVVVVVVRRIFLRVPRLCNYWHWQWQYRDERRGVRLLPVNSTTCWEP